MMKLILMEYGTLNKRVIVSVMLLIVESSDTMNEPLPIGYKVTIIIILCVNAEDSVSLLRAETVV